MSTLVIRRAPELRPSFEGDIILRGEFPMVAAGVRWEYHELVSNHGLTHFLAERDGSLISWK
jgi:hypothetical protein